MNLFRNLVAFIQCLFPARLEEERLDPDAYAALLQHDADVRTEWVRKSRVDEGGVSPMQRAWDWFVQA